MVPVICARKIGSASGGASEDGDCGYRQQGAKQPKVKPRTNTHHPASLYTPPPARKFRNMRCLVA